MKLFMNFAKLVGPIMIFSFLKSLNIIKENIHNFGYYLTWTIFHVHRTSNEATACLLDLEHTDPTFIEFM